MPIYIYKHPQTEELKEIIQSMNESHEYIDDKGLKWERIFSSPQAVIDGKLNVWSPQKFIDKTGKSKGTVGDLLDRSKEASEQRAKEAGGIDPIKQRHFEEYSRIRKGRLHMEDPRRTPK